MNGQPALFETDEYDHDHVTIWCLDWDGAVLDKIEAYLGPRGRARADGRVSLHEACLWGYVAWKNTEGVTT